VLAALLLFGGLSRGGKCPSHVSWQRMRRTGGERRREAGGRARLARGAAARSRGVRAHGSGRGGAKQRRARAAARGTTV
jgi:hypothetical protein